MVFFRTGKDIRSGRLVASLLVFLLTCSLYAQSEEDEGVEIPLITVEISPEKILVGQRFDLTIFADFSSYRNVSIKEPQLPDGIVLASGPYKSAQTINIGDPVNPQYIKKTRIFYKFKVTKPGLYTVDSFSLSDGDTTLMTDPVMFPVLAFDERELKYPVFARWNNIPQTIFVGETIPLILEMENLEELSFPERISLTPPAGGVFEQVNSVGEITVTTIGDDEVYIAPIDSWMFTPTTSGAVKIPAAEVSFKNIKRSTEPAIINVLEVPADVGFSGAIGDFEVTTEIENIPFQKSRTTILRIRVEGEGNLNYLRMPDPEFSGLNLIEKEELYKISPSLSGYGGYREDVYRLSVAQEDLLTIKIEPWNWFNRASGTVLTQNFAGYNFEYNTEEQLEEYISLRDEFPLLSTAKIIKYRDSVYNVGWYYLLLLPGVISVLAALVRRRIDMKILGYSLLFIVLNSSSIDDIPRFRERLDTAQEYLDLSESEKALFLYDEIISEFGENPGIYYNQALINYDLDNKDKVIHLLRKSLLMKPGDRVFMKTLTSVENEFGLEHQATATSGFSPDLLFLSFILLFNMGAFLSAFNIGRKKIELSILIVMVFFLSLSSLGVVLYTDYISMRETAVIVEEGGELKKVPGFMGASWLTLQEGTAVYLKSESEESYLIRTGYGLEGWLDKSSLIPLQDNE